MSRYLLVLSVYRSILISCMSCSPKAKVGSSLGNGAGCGYTYGCMNYTKSAPGFKTRVQENLKRKAYLLLNHIPDNPRHLITIHLCSPGQAVSILASSSIAAVQLPCMYQRCMQEPPWKGSCTNYWVLDFDFVCYKPQHLVSILITSRSSKKTIGHLPAIVLANPLADKYGIKFTEDEVPVLVEALRAGRKVPRAAATAVVE